MFSALQLFAGTFSDRVGARRAYDPAQVMLRWHLQEGRSVIPKSENPDRIAANFDVFDFELSPEQITAIDGLDTGVRGGPEPETVTPEAFSRDIPEA
ncbi:diketogulonate reductase-like aldo/keto reductase [Arthrobacter globiformis]|nr:diketogulonate reductase-like aldo/keto reductase [Arthrobacter globiformis]